MKSVKHTELFVFSFMLSGQKNIGLFNMVLLDKNYHQLNVNQVLFGK